MKKFIIPFLFVGTIIMHAQVGVGTTSPSEASMLEINGVTGSGEYRGFMPPRVPTTTERDAIPTTATDIGLLVFVQDIACLQMWNGTAWEDVRCVNATVSGNIWVNEFHYDHNGIDTNEFIEIAGPAGLDLTGYTIVLYNGNNGQSYDTDNLTGTLTDDTGTGFGFSVINYNNILQNGPDGIALVDGTGTVVSFISYEGSFTATNGPANGLTADNISESQTGNGALDPVGGSLQLIGTGNSYTDFTWSRTQVNTSGSLNTGQTIN